MSFEEKGLCRKEREKQQRRHEILAAAERVFIRKGYQNTTVEEIAQEAELATGSIYNSFRSKEELYSALAERIGEEFLPALENEIAQESDPEKALRRAIELHLQLFHQHRAFMRVAFEVAPGLKYDAAALPERCRRIQERYIEILIEVCRRGVANGVFEADDPLYLALCLEGVLNAVSVYWMRHEQPDPLDVRIAKVQKEFLGRIRRQSAT